MFGFFRKREPGEEEVENIQEQLDAVKEISHLLVSGNDLNQILDLVMTSICSMLKVNTAAILLWDEEEKFVIKKVSLPRALKKVTESIIGQKLNNLSYYTKDINNIFFKSIKSKKIEYVIKKDLTSVFTPITKKANAVRLVNLLKKNLKCVISSPLVINDNVIGALAIGWREEEINKGDKRVLEILTNQLAIAIHNSKLYNKIQIQVEDLATRNLQQKSIVEFTNRIITTLNVDEVLQSVLNSISEIFGYSTVVYLEPNKEKDAVVPVSFSKNKITEIGISFLPHGPLDFKFDVYDPDLKDSIFTKAYLEKKMYFTNKVDNITKKSLPAFISNKIQKVLGIKTLTAIPVIYKDEVIGLLCILLQKKKPEDLQKLELDTFSLIANQIGVALENARLHEKIQLQTKDLAMRNEQLQLITEFSNKINSIIEDTKLPQIILDEINHIFGYATAFYLEFDNENKLLKPVAHSKNKLGEQCMQLLEAGKEDFGLEISDPKFQNALVVRSFIENKILIGDTFFNTVKEIITNKRQKEINPLGNIKTVAAIPIKTKNKISGILALLIQNRFPDEISKIEIDTMALLASQISTAIDNAKLYTRTQKQATDLLTRNENLEMISDFTKDITSNLETDKIAQNTLDSIEIILGYLGGIFVRYDNETRLLKIFKFTNARFLEYGKKLLKQTSFDMEVSIDRKDLQENIIVRSIKDDTIHMSSNLKDASYGFLPDQVTEKVQKEFDIKTVASVPVKTQDKPIGVLLYILNKRYPSQITELELDTMSIIAGQVGIALNNADLYTKVQKSLEEAKQFNEILQRKYQEEKDIIGILGHELRTPLGIAKNNLELLIDKIKAERPLDNDYLIKKLGSTYQAIIRESQIVQTALSTAHVDNDKINLIVTPVDVDEIILDYGINPHKMDASLKGISLNYENKTGNHPIIHTDGTKLQEVITNLISNAVKYTHKGHVNVTLEKDEQNLILTVEDSGIGIPDKEIRRLGGRFHRVKQYTTEEDKNIPRPGGTGLGLYIVKAYLKAMGGQLIVKSEVGKGSTFVAIVPLDHASDNSETADLYVHIED